MLGGKSPSRARQEPVKSRVSSIRYRSMKHLRTTFSCLVSRICVNNGVPEACQVYDTERA